MLLSFCNLNENAHKSICILFRCVNPQAAVIYLLHRINSSYICVYVEMVRQGGLVDHTLALILTILVCTYIHFC